MPVKQARHKAKVGLKVIHEGGVVSFFALVLEFIAKHLRTISKTNNIKDKDNPIYTRVKYSDALKADVHKPYPAWQGTTKNQLTFNWLMPPPGRGSGGHLNIYRFIQSLEKAGHICRIYLYTQDKGGRVEDVKAVMGSSYPDVKATMYWLESEEDMKSCDGMFATSWETAYPTYNSKLSAKRFYFVQDFEPYFYAPGSLYALAENTYRFGFYGVTAGGWLAKKLRDDYGMKTDSYNFGADRSNYFYTNSKKRKEVFFYARPYTERRGFEMGIMALDLFHQKHPDYVINMAGYDVSTYHIPFPYRNLKTLEIDELNDLYNRCSAALVLSFTNMSLLPLELLASGTIPIVNDADNNRMVSNNEYIAYAASDPVSLANKLSEIIHKADAEYSKAAANSVKGSSWIEAGNKFVNIVERETRIRG